jgi:acyl-[acyl-carrier-protein]-phospholipid O-acyltransferase/long-chain-fatty-acid--[acyl-carrier-protein] ligase
LYNGINKHNEHEFPAKAAVTLFTSGSEGAPKGVLLSHANIQANRFQLTARVDFSPADRVFNALPMFHAFGLTAATLLPIVSGMRVFMYPSPLHYRIVPEVCYDTNSTITFGTDTFLSGYAKYAHPYNFYSIRYIFAGAEKLREETRRIWMQKFGIRLFEGYGATEASPVLSTNTAMQYKAGTVGRLLPCIKHELRPVEGINDGARLCIAGPNVMMGYMFAHTPGVIQPLEDGWHDTGDIVSIDKEGYITIKGRAKRFAKIAGEMVSLTAIEDELYLLWPENQHAILCMPDPRKGEQIILITNNKNATQKQVIEHFKVRGVADIAIPRKLLILPKMPVLGSGKVDYQAAKFILENNQSDDVAEEEDDEADL